SERSWRLGAGERLQRGEESAVRTRQLLEDREVIVPGDRDVATGQAAPLPRLPVLVGLPDELGQLVETDGDDQRRRAVGKVMGGTGAVCLGRIEPELLVEIVQADGLEVVETADGDAARQ